MHTVNLDTTQQMLGELHNWAQALCKLNTGSNWWAGLNSCRQRKASVVKEAVWWAPLWAQTKAASSKGRYIPIPSKGHTILQYHCGQGTQPIFIPIWHFDKVRWVGQSWGAGVFVPRFLQINRNPRDATKCSIDHLVNTTRIKVPHSSSHSCVPGPRTLTSLRILQRRQQIVEVLYFTRKSVVRFCRIWSPFSIIWENQQDCNSQQMTPKTYPCQRSQIIFRLINIPGQKQMPFSIIQESQRKTSRGRDLKSCNVYFIFIQGSVSRKRPVGKPYLQSFCQLEYSLASRGQRLNFMGILEVENSFKKACRTNKSRGRDISLLIIIPISSKKYEKSTKFGSFLDIPFQQLRLMACKKTITLSQVRGRRRSRSYNHQFFNVAKIKGIHSFKAYIRWQTRQ